MIKQAILDAYKKSCDLDSTISCHLPQSFWNDFDIGVNNTGVLFPKTKCVPLHGMSLGILCVQTIAYLSIIEESYGEDVCFKDMENMLANRRDSAIINKIGEVGPIGVFQNPNTYSVENAADIYSFDSLCRAIYGWEKNEDWSWTWIMNPKEKIDGFLSRMKDSRGEYILDNDKLLGFDIVFSTSAPSHSIAFGPLNAYFATRPRMMDFLVGATDVEGEPAVKLIYKEKWTGGILDVDRGLWKTIRRV